VSVTTYPGTLIKRVNTNKVFNVIHNTNNSLIVMDMQTATHHTIFDYDFNNYKIYKQNADQDQDQ
jgi:hypothetical protein